MGDWRTQTEHWLFSEERGRDDAAEEAFTQLLTALPVAEPSAGFVDRAVEAARAAGARRHRRRAAAAIAASLLLAGLGGATAYGVFGIAGGWLLTMTAAAGASSVLFTVTIVTTVMAWWADSARIAGAVMSVMAMPQGAATLAVIELVAAGALYALHRLLRGDVRWRGIGIQLC